MKRLLDKTFAGFLVRSRVIAVAMAVAISLAGAGNAWAQDLDTYRNAGQIGERTDGYVGIVSANPDARLREFVSDLNRKRRRHYEAIARENGTSLDAVARRAGQKLTQSAKPGTYVQNSSGAWVQHQ